ncbi:MAG: hypothetical protein ACM36C_04430 [Acidobacteriota bacterium]
MRVLSGVGIYALFVLTACGGSSQPGNPVSPSPSVPLPSLTGSWTGAASDSSGSMMGGGMSAAMMNQMTWQITQTGNTFQGTMQFAGYAGHGAMTISGIINGTTTTFTMTMPSGSMMMGTCSAQASGIFDINELMNQMHGTYSGTNSCTGAFDHGQLSLSR